MKKSFALLLSLACILFLSACSPAPAPAVDSSAHSGKRIVSISIENPSAYEIAHLSLSLVGERSTDENGSELLDFGKSLLSDADMVADALSFQVSFDATVVFMLSGQVEGQAFPDFYFRLEGDSDCFTFLLLHDTSLGYYLSRQF